MYSGKIDVFVWSYNCANYNFYSYIGYSKYNEVVLSRSSLFSIYGDEFAYYGGILNAMEEAECNKIKKLNVLVSNVAVLQNIVEEKATNNRFLNEIIGLKKTFTEFNIGYMASKDNLARFEEADSIIEKTRKLSFYDRAMFLAISNWLPLENIDGLAVQNEDTGIVYGISADKRDKDKEYVLLGMSNKRAQSIMPGFVSYCKHCHDNEQAIRNMVWNAYLNVDKMLEIS